MALITSGAEILRQKELMKENERKRGEILGKKVLCLSVYQ